MSCQVSDDYFKFGYRRYRTVLNRPNNKPRLNNTIKMTYSIRHSPKYAIKNTKQTPDSHWLWLSVYLGITALYRWAKFQIPLRLLIFWYNISMQNTTFGILIRHFNTNFIKNGIGSWFQRGTKIQNDHLYPENQLNMNFVLTCIINNVVLLWNTTFTFITSVEQIRVQAAWRRWIKITDYVLHLWQTYMI